MITFHLSLHLIGAAEPLCLRLYTFRGLTRGEPRLLGALSIYGHLRHAKCSIPLFNASRTPLSGSNRASRAALVQPTPPPPPLLIHRLQIPTTTSSPSASTVIRLITTIGSDHTQGGDDPALRPRPARDNLDSSDPSLRLSHSLSFLSSTCARAFYTFCFYFLVSTENFLFCDHLDTCASCPV